MSQPQQAAQVIRSFFESLRSAGVVFGVLHGLEGFPESHGRDIDIFVHPEHAEKAHDAATNHFRKVGWQAGAHRMAIGLDQWFVRVPGAEGGELWLEFDLIHHHPFCWWGQELVPQGLEPQDLVSDAGQPYDAWGWFAKNLLIQLLAGNQQKFLANLEELNGRAEFLPKVRHRADAMGLGAAVDAIVQAANPRENFGKLQREARRVVLARLLRPPQWPAIAKGVVPWIIRTWKLHFPILGCVPKVHVHGGDVAQNEAFAAALAERANALFPFPSVVVRPGRKVLRAGDGVIARGVDLKRGGWNRQLRDSSWLVLQIEVWPAIPDPGDAVTPSDLHVEAGPLAPDEALSETIGRIGDALIANLHRTPP